MILAKSPSGQNILLRLLWEINAKSLTTVFLIPSHVTFIIVITISHKPNVSPRINIKGGGVHKWYMMFNQQCSISVVKQHFSA